MRLIIGLGKQAVVALNEANEAKKTQYLDGDKLVLQSEKIVIIEQVQNEILETPATVYNFEVEDFHTYYVTSSSVLVHNSCGGGFNKYSASQLSKMVSGNFHGADGAKNAILKDISASILKKVGKNPDIYVNNKGVIGIYCKERR